MEYEVHTQLMNKLKLKGMNALFGLRIQITVGENMLMGLAVSLDVLVWFCDSGSLVDSVLCDSKSLLKGLI